jgi:hypothetical protein
MRKKTPQSANELLRRVTEKILKGDGIKKRIEADARKPAIYSRNDGVIFDPRWQDDGVCHGL